MRLTEGTGVGARLLEVGAHGALTEGVNRPHKLRLERDE
jgi:hypothetical protein